MEKLGNACIALYNKCREFYHKFTKRQWKMAGIVLLVLLAAGFVLSFTLNTDSRHYEAEQKLVSNMNTVLREREKHYEIPGEMARIMEIIEHNGYSAEQLQLEGGRTLTWVQNVNRFAILNRSGDVIFPDGVPNDLSGYALGDDNTYVIPADSTDDFKWEQTGVEYFLTDDLHETLVSVHPLLLDMNGHTAHGGILVQHDETGRTRIENGYVGGLLAVDTPQAPFIHSGGVHDLAVVQSGGYTEEGIVYGLANVYSGNAVLEESAHTLLSVGAADGCTTDTRSAYAAFASHPADVLRARAQAGETAGAVLQALEENKLSTEHCEAVLKAAQENTDPNVQKTEEDGLIRWEIGGSQPASFTIEQYTETGRNPAGSTVFSHTVSVLQEYGDENILSTGICTAGQGSVTHALTRTGSDDITTLVCVDAAGETEVSSGKIQSVESHDVVVALGASQSPGVTVHFEDGTAAEDYPGLVWRSKDTGIATVLGGNISAAALGSAEITVHAGRSLASVHVDVQPAAADIDGNKYVSLSAAIDAARPGDTISLLADCSGETAAVTRPVTIICGGFPVGEITYPDSMVRSEVMDTYSFNGRVTAHVYGAINDPDSVVDDTVTGTLTQVIDTLMSLDYKYNTLHFELYIAGDYALEDNISLPVRVASATSFVITGDTMFDLNGHVIAQEAVSTTGGARPVFRIENGTLRVTDHKGTGQIAACQTVADIQPGASLELNRVSLSHSAQTSPVLLNNSGSLSMENCVVTTYSDAIAAIQNNDADALTLKNTSFYSKEGSASIGGKTDLTIENCKFESTDVTLDEGDIYVNGARGGNSECGICTLSGDMLIQDLNFSGRIRTEDGSMEITDGTFNGPVYCTDKLTVHTGRFSGLFFGNGDTQIQSGTFSAPTYFYGKTTILDGSFSNSTYFYEEATIEGGVFHSIVYAFEAGADITINGGDFPNYVDAYGGDITINGGSFLHIKEETGKLRINGGSFRSDRFLKFLTEGCTWKETTQDGKTVYVVTAP